MSYKNYLPKFHRETLLSDLSAGLTLAFVSIPISMAYALLAGVDPIYGIYTAMLTVIIGSLAASSSLMIVTISDEVALVVASSVGALGGDVTQGLVTLTLLVGLLQFATGQLKMGSLVRFISAEVMSGFIAAVGLSLVISQLAKFTGYKSTAILPYISDSIIQGMDIITHPGLWDLPTFLVGVVTIVVLILFKWSRLKRYGNLLAMVIISAMVALLGLTTVKLTGSIAPISGVLPKPVLPNPMLIPDLILPALAILILTSIQTVGVGSAYPNPDGKRTNRSKNFSAQGLANIGGSIFTALPAGGSFTRTGVNIESGGKTRWSGVFSGIFVIVIFLLIPQMFEKVPMSGLAAILIALGATIVINEWNNIVLAWKSSNIYRYAMLLTFVVGVGFSIEYAVFAGAILSLLIYAFTTHKDIMLEELVLLDDGRYQERSLPDEFPTNKCTVIEVKGLDYFAVAYLLEEQMPSIENTTCAVIILNLHDRKYLGTNVVVWMNEFARKLHESGNLLMLAEVEDSIKKQLERTGVLEEIGSKNVFMASSIVNDSIREAALSANKWIKANKIQ
ncbi:SulP family inorganic anion transporter [Methanobacterium sp. 42_16]|uniref:SulP family inorganic anion transporter n=1 Tax=Methanobacterium sp. 42_16 TaxID=1641383 RepID=UPI0007496D72|nr:SulP family inorganic anion transporter [Methanobacterium sp. 42_16]KUK73617.1 MAG: sulfate transporter [Methanobacterium sp. 42_16]